MSARRVARTLAAVAALLATAVASPTARAAEPTTDPSATLDPGGTLTVKVSITTPGEHQAANAHLVNITYTVLGDEPAVAGSLVGLCNAGPYNDPTKSPGFQWRVIGTLPVGTVIEDTVVCVPFTTTGPVTQPAVPQVPTVEEAWNTSRLLAPTVTLDPPTRGITGLDTIITTAGPTTITIDATIRGYRIVGTATLDHTTIAVDGQPLTNGDNGHYIFTTKGEHTIAVARVWHGRAVLTGPDLTGPITLPDIGTATITTTRTYSVHEIRSVLQP